MLLLGFSSGLPFLLTGNTLGYWLRDEGTTILLVEQNALMALDVADRGYVMETGTIALSDDAKALRENEKVKQTYLGVD